MLSLHCLYPEFSPGLKIVSCEILSDQQRWAKVKLFASAGLSICDMLTDVSMVIEYFGRGERNFAWAILACILTNLGFQSMLTLIQHRRQPLRRQLKEVSGVGRWGGGVEGV